MDFTDKKTSGRNYKANISQIKATNFPNNLSFQLKWVPLKG